MSEEKEIEEQPLKFEEDKPAKSWFDYFIKLIKFVAIIGAIAAMVLYLPLFRLDEVIVKGNRTVANEDIFRIAGIRRGEHILKIKKEQIASMLQNDLRIEEVRVERIFPNGLEITVKERQPVACMVCEYGFLAVDSNGIVVEAYRYPRKQNDIIYISGVKLHDLYVGDTINDEEIKGILLYLKAISPDLRSYISELSMNNRERITARTTKGAEIRIGKVERLTEKSRHTEKFLQEFATSNRAVDYVDFQYKSPFIKFK